MWLLPPPEFEYNTIQRMCPACFKSLSSLDFDRYHEEWGQKGAPVQPTPVPLPSSASMLG